MRIQNLGKTIQQIQHEFSEFVLQNTQEKTDTLFSSEIYRHIKKSIHRIDILCAKHNVTPADLATPSFRKYLWLRFLAERENTKAHICALSNGYSVLLQSIPAYKNYKNLKTIHIQFDCSSYLFHIKKTQDKLHFQIHEALMHMPADLMCTLITTALNQKSRKELATIKSYTATREYQKCIAAIAGQPIANKKTYRGKFFNLQNIFHANNRQYFNNTLVQPRLVWSSQKSTSRWGYFHPELHTISINKKLDAPGTPILAVKYIMFHEMLHQNLGFQHINGRRYAHTKEFKQQEKTFEGYRQAENLIKLIQ